MLEKEVKPSYLKVAFRKLEIFNPSLSGENFVISAAIGTRLK